MVIDIYGFIVLKFTRRVSRGFHPASSLFRPEHLLNGALFEGLLHQQLQECLRNGHLLRQLLHLLARCFASCCSLAKGESARSLCPIHRLDLTCTHKGWHEGWHIVLVEIKGVDTVLKGVERLDTHVAVALPWHWL